MVLALAVSACSDGETELSTGSTIITGWSCTATTSSTRSSPTQTLLGQAVSEYTVAERVPNENGEELYIVIPDGAYTDVDLENFILDLIDADPTMYGAEVFDDADAVAAFKVDAAERTEEQKALLENHFFLTLVGRERIEFNGPFADFPGGAIGS